MAAWESISAADGCEVRCSTFTRTCSRRLSWIRVRVPSAVQVADRVDRVPPWVAHWSSPAAAGRYLRGEDRPFGVAGVRRVVPWSSGRQVIGKGGRRGGGGHTSGKVYRQGWGLRSRRFERVSCELDLMGLDQPRYVVVNGWPEGSHPNEVMATRGACASVTSTCEGDDCCSKRYRVMRTERP